MYHCWHGSLRKLRPSFAILNQAIPPHPPVNTARYKQSQQYRILARECYEGEFISREQWDISCEVRWEKTVESMEVDCRSAYMSHYMRGEADLLDIELVSWEDLKHARRVSRKRKRTNATALNSCELVLRQEMGSVWL